MKRVPKKVIAFHRNLCNGVLMSWYGYGSFRICGMYYLYTFWFKDAHYINLRSRRVRFRL